jgi:expansin (peptidoglycan-binding protein)
MPRFLSLGALIVVMLCGAVWSLTAYSQSAPQQDEPPQLYLPLVRTPDAPAQQNPLREGRATYYNATGAGNCSFDPSPQDLMVAAISYEDYGSADYCGTYVEVYGPEGTVTVRIVDKCPDAQCTAGHLDLSREAFAQIAPLERGIVPITWRVVSPELSGPIAYHFKEGSNQWWTAVQVRNHRNPVTKLEYQTAGGGWVAAPRVDYNFFLEAAGMGPGPYTFRVTDSYGNVLEDSNIPFREGGVVPGAAQFPAGP